MRDIEFYIGKFPYRKTQIAKHRHLQFHVEMEDVSFYAMMPNENIKEDIQGVLRIQERPENSGAVG